MFKIINPLKNIKNKFLYVIKPDKSINKDLYKFQYKQKQSYWNMAFDFISNSDLKNLENKRYDINGDNVYATVSEYLSKDLKDTKWEAHRKYIDIQYVINGEELIGLTSIEKTVKQLNYDEDKDVCFFDADSSNFLMADCKHYFIFFPDNVHRPCVKINQNTQVKKLVIKIKM